MIIIAFHDRRWRSHPPGLRASDWRWGILPSRQPTKWRVQMIDCRGSNTSSLSSFPSIKVIPVHVVHVGARSATIYSPEAPLVSTERQVVQICVLDGSNSNGCESLETAAKELMCHEQNERSRGWCLRHLVIYLSVFQGVSVICRYCDRMRVGVL